MKKFFAIIPGLVIAMGIVSVGGYFALASKLKIQKVDLLLHPDSKEQTLFAEIQEELSPRLEKLIGRSILQFSFESMVNEILEDQRIKNVHLRRQLPGTLLVQIEPQEPVMSWVDERGFIHPVSKTNRILPRLKSSLGKDFALLRGSVFFENESVRKLALDLISKLPMEGYFRKSLVSEIRYSKASGFDLILSEPSILIKIGTEDVSTKSAQVEKVLSYLHHRGIKGRVIDSRFDKKVVVRLRNEP